MRSKIGAFAAAKEGETVVEIKGVPAAAQPQTTVAGTKDKIWCEAVAVVASIGAECEVGAALQQAILPPQPQSRATGPAAGAAATTTWPQRSSRLQMMVSAIFTGLLSSSQRAGAGRILP
jgi:hypothetical protein